MTMLAQALRDGDASLFRGTTAPHALGWLSPGNFSLPSLSAWCRTIPDDVPVVWLGMGGSSSTARLFEHGPSAHRLRIVDTSHPDSYAEIDFSTSWVVAASKSGTTLELQIGLAHALSHGLDPSRLVVITDPGTSLAELARSLGASVISGDDKTGGRFSALSPFGLVAASLSGYSVEEMSQWLAEAAPSDDQVERAMSVVTHARASGDVQLPGDPLVDGGALWLEQLIAESTGKDGKGFLPSVGPSTPVDPHDIYHWHLVAALLAREIGVDPFNQPDVERAKQCAFSRLRQGVGDRHDASLTGAIPIDVDRLHLLVFAPLAMAGALAAWRDDWKTHHPRLSAGLGPRYLHSTGQFHKGGPASQGAIQVRLFPTTADERLSGRAYSLGDVIAAQAKGDADAWREKGRSICVVEASTLAEARHMLEPHF